MPKKGGKNMSAYSPSRTYHSMTSLVRNNRTGELYRRGIILSRAALYRSMPTKAGHYSHSPCLTAGAEDKK